MRELRDLVARARTLATEGGRAVVATIVRVEGSSYRREGARMLLETDGEMTGVLSGGCLERDLAARAAQVAADGRPRLEIYDLLAEEEAIWGLGLGCAGRVTLLLERLPEPRAMAALEALAESFERRREVRLATVLAIEGDLPLALGDRIEGSSAPAGDPAAGALVARLAALPAGTRCHQRIELAAGALEALLEAVPPPPELLLIGAGRDLPPLARLGHQLGWEVRVIDPRPTPAAAARFTGVADYRAARPRGLAAAAELGARTAAVLATHAYLDDLAFLPELLASPAPYLALLGPIHRRERLLADLARQSAADAASARRRLRSPAGLDLGATSPEEIALAIVAEAQAALAGRGAAPLSARAASDAAGAGS